MPMRVTAFTTWLRANGEQVPSFVGDNWYEVERAAALRDEILQLRRLREELDAAPGDIPADVYAAAAVDGSSARPRGRGEVFSTAARPNIVAAGSRRRPPSRRRG
jgi:hypothetical protein